ncbi:putative prenyl cysteine carboxyl methyltransferase [Aspergillus heteromorphus CBS 117.55]|uniref:Protein-S-isoprenylcysteine O-methyltransferase n=1 Tax=Aspergillus heteromorphus CBS 117.55 TaxID=1448321 RepID=A0A317VN18_9EURO|nr:putative prenyl cysteine carboxyl methyltransferase [Aspergillus heteromorphus CBS 117.55]PWY74328.1 putative prenyl cysteine carboxyl methyltransferase [Aspergillus heteromorphus CBS 117.55]
MSSISSISLSLSLLAVGYLFRRSCTPPHRPSSATATPDRVRLLAGPITTITTHLGCLCIIYHALIALLYSESDDTYEHNTPTDPTAIHNTITLTLHRICPHPTNLPPQLFTWTPTTALCLLSIALGTTLRLAAFRSLGRNFTFELAQPDSLVTAGMYRFVQHPSYTGLWLLAAGQLGLVLRWDGAAACGMDAGTLERLSGWGGWALGALVVVLMRFTVMRIRDEERMLQTKFGGEWEGWHARTARMVPFLL